MKITTEIIHSLFIISCEGPILDAQITEDFLAAMKGRIKKNQMDILLDLSAVDFVDSNGLESIIHSFKEIHDLNQLTVCGVSDKSLSLLTKTSLPLDQRVFIGHETDRNTALKKLFWDEDRESEKILSSDIDQPEENELAAILREAEEMQQDTSRQAGVTDKNTEEAQRKERRKYRRIADRQIMNDAFIIYCRNTTTGKHQPARVLNISAGGLLMEARSQLTIGESLLLEGRIGRNFKFKERAVSRSRREKKRYGIEFINLSGETSHFLNQLTGSVGMTQSNHFLHEQPN